MATNHAKVATDAVGPLTVKPTPADTVTERATVALIAAPVWVTITTEFAVMMGRAIARVPAASVPTPDWAVEGKDTGAENDAVAPLMGGPPVEVMVSTGTVAPAPALSIAERTVLPAVEAMRRPVVAGEGALTATLAAEVLIVAAVMGGPPDEVMVTRGMEAVAPAL